MTLPQQLGHSEEAYRFSLDSEQTLVFPQAMQRRSPTMSVLTGVIGEDAVGGERQTDSNSAYHRRKRNTAWAGGIGICPTRQAGFPLARTRGRLTLTIHLPMFEAEKVTPTFGALTWHP
jgi:hypothetical protein